MDGWGDRKRGSNRHGGENKKKVAGVTKCKRSRGREEKANVRGKG